MLGTNNTLEARGDMFDWKKGIGYTDASSIGLPITSNPVHCIAVRSHKTGKREFFFYLRRNTLGEDAVEYHYASAKGYMLIIADD